MNTLESLARMIAAGIRPLLSSIEGDPVAVAAFGELLGWVLPSPPPVALVNLVTPTANVVDSAQLLEHVLVDVAEGANDVDQTTSAAVALVLDLAAWALTVAELPGELRTQLSQEYLNASRIDEKILDRLYGLLLVSATADSAPRVFAILRLIGLIEDVLEPADSTRHQPEFQRREFRWNRAAQLLTDPGAVLQDLYGWRTPTLNFERLYDSLLGLGISIIAPPELDYPSDEFFALVAPNVALGDASRGISFPFLDLETTTLSASVVPLPSGTAPQPLAFTIRAAGLGSQSISLYPGARIDLEASADLSSGFCVVVYPDRKPKAFASLDSGVVFDAGRVSARFVYSGENQIALLTVSSNVGVGARTLYLGCGVEATSSDVRPFVEAGINEGVIVVRRGSLDSFAGSLLPEDGIELKFDLGARWTESGISLQGSGGLETAIAIGRKLGPLYVDTLHARVEATNAALRGELAVSGRGGFGPLTISIERIGVAFDLLFSPGNLGPVGLDLRFKPPSGAGIAVSAGPIVGSGHLTLDPNAGRYSGRVQLEALGINLSALGIVETKVPEIPGGFSCVMAVSATFSPVQLGLGFTLNGVGGLIGIHRRVNFDAMRAALRGAGIGDIFFATDPAAQAARMLGDLATYFPAAEGRYVFGPAAKIGWGTPTIVEGDIALLFEVPAPVRIFLVGSVHTALPTKAKPIIALRIDVLGELDLANKRLAIDASLRDSKVAGFPLTGDMALRMSWGSPPSFVLSVGGFHSQFRPPPGFPALRRVQILIGADDNPRLDVQGFLALTSNTAQIGAQVELYAAAGPLNIKGTLGFEALFQFSPFSFRVDLWAGVALRRGKTTLASVHFDGTLTGPTPWKIAGEACLSLWFIDLCVDFEATFGQKEATELPEREIWPLLEAALESPASWGTELPPTAARAVTTAPPVGEASQTLIDPVAALTVRQKVAPLNREITRFGQTAPAGANRFDVTQVKVGAVPAAFVPVTEWFAPAQFEDLEDADRLARSGFEQMDAGVTISSAAVTAGSVLITPLDYETVVIQSGARNQGPNFRPTVLAQIAGTARSAAAGAGLRSPAPPVPRVRLDEERFVVASTHDLAPRLDIAAAASRGAVALALAAFLRDNPAERGRVEVVPMHEAAA